MDAASPGQVWFEQFARAQRQRDLATMWELQTRDSHALVLERMAGVVDRARADAQYRKQLKEAMGADVRHLEPKQVWETFTAASCASVAAGRLGWRYLDEVARADGTVLVRVAMQAGTQPLPAGMGGALAQVLRNEDGAWKVDKPATEALIAQD